MSGFEIAGVVLSSLPVIISAIEHYVDLVQTVKLAMKFKIELKNLKHNLDAESAVFLDTLERVLDGLIPAKQLEELLKDAASTLWRDDILNKQLQDRLGRSYNVFTDTVNDMNATVQEFIKRLDLDDQGNVRWTEGTGLRLALKRAGFSLRKRDFDDLIEPLRGHNRHLEKFTNGSIEFESSRRKRKKYSKLQKLGEYAKSAFHALEASFGCDCQGPDGHTALFGITPQSSRLGSRSSKPQGKIEFQVVVSGIFSEKGVSLDGAIIWQEMSLEAAEDDSNSHAQSQIDHYSTQSLGCLPTAPTRPDKLKRRRVGFCQALQIWSSTPSQLKTQTT
jgi:hypothetical protein